jgi:hypothetical protein
MKVIGIFTSAKKPWSFSWLPGQFWSSKATMHWTDWSIPFTGAQKCVLLACCQAHWQQLLHWVTSFCKGLCISGPKKKTHNKCCTTNNFLSCENTLTCLQHQWRG